MARSFRSNQSSFRGSRGVRRETQWRGTVVSAVGPQIVAVSSKLLLGNITAAQFAGEVPLTLVRTRGVFGFHSDQISASEDQVGAFGIAIVEEQARAAGVASLPGPQTNSAWDGWLYWHAIQDRLAVATAVGVADHFQTVIEIDSKAMRKINDNEALVLIAENASASHVFSVSINVRTLYKMH